MNKLVAVLKLTRIEHSVMLVIAVLAGELIVARHLPGAYVLLLSLIVPIFVSMGSFAINDYFDVEVDTLNKKVKRPIVSGAISREGAMYVAAASFAVGVAASALINYYAFAIALVFAALAALYSYKLKEMLLVGNIYIAFSMAIPFIFGDYVMSTSLNANIVLISMVILVSGTAREIHGMIRDYHGDTQARRIRNLPYHIGLKRSSYTAMVLYLSGIAISIFMFFFQKPFSYNLVYIVPILITDLMLLYVSAFYAKNYRAAREGVFDTARNVSLGAMALALVAYLLSSALYVGIFSI
ncbi:UbiA prenyltransferase [mine drainage metagenome]|uniref:UbiA prenyltransferase n=1 Tax=mine drainage metagenome TaxID=410659 RepID=T1AMF1_9ZZZZ